MGRSSRFSDTLLTTTEKLLQGLCLTGERYDSDEKPVISLSTPDGDIGPGDSFTVSVLTENVASFADLYDVRYIQLSVEQRRFGSRKRRIRKLHGRSGRMLEHSRVVMRQSPFTKPS